MFTAFTRKVLGLMAVAGAVTPAAGYAQQSGAPEEDTS